MVQAVACHSALGNNAVRQMYFQIPARAWENIETTDPVWKSGDLRYSQRADHGMGFVTIRHYDVRFEPQGVRAIIKNAAKPAAMPAIAVPAYPSVTVSAPPANPIAAAAPNKGGRPKNDWWDEFWIEICRQIFDNELKVIRQADIEQAMLQWATNQGHDLSEAYAREKARKLFNAWKLGARN
jgi:hypothetical protein